MSVSVQESYRLCGELARKAGANCYVSFLAMPKAKREAMCAVYAFMRRSDDIADDAPNPAAAMASLRAWRERVVAALESWSGVSPDTAPDKNRRDACSTDPILSALADVVKKFGIERRYLFELLDGAKGRVPNQLVSAWASAQRHEKGHRKIADKSNENSAEPE